MEIFILGVVIFGMGLVGLRVIMRHYSTGAHVFFVALILGSLFLMITIREQLGRQEVFSNVTPDFSQIPLKGAVTCSAPVTLNLHYKDGGLDERSVENVGPTVCRTPPEAKSTLTGE